MRGGIEGLFGLVEAELVNPDEIRADFDDLAVHGEVFPESKADDRFFLGVFFQEINKMHDFFLSKAFVL